MSTEVKINFDVYVQKYAEQKGITVEEAMTHEIVQEVKAYYERE